MRIENSFIPVYGVGEATERQLWTDGITHWDEFSADAVGPKTAARIESFIDDARKHLSRNEFEFFAEEVPPRYQWRLFENAGDEACYLDIETTGLSRDRHDVTTVTIHRAGETTTLVRGTDLDAATLRAELDDVPLLVTFNGRRFDVPFLESSFDVELSAPHLDLYYPCRSLDLTGGLDGVESALGIERDLPDLSGRDAVRLWRAYEAGDDEALETLIRYNRADTENLATIASHVTSRMHRTVFEAVCAGEETD
ncbi:ribonuclease H-like domain-containing protein [Halovivax limisalsi]|uniref:ribonuclease H-like domain-containing protein n=1 Tax=Halovivax limisalsi TaxID=1453760 RepID=UPI001FFD8456|nr:ribonuclease H-like domain-containing protein [Halovivax limisalsi]